MPIMHRTCIISLHGISLSTLLRSQVQHCPKPSFRRIPQERSPQHCRRFASYTSETSAPNFNASNRLSGRTCMVTGGSSGIGFAIAQRFLQEDVDRVILVGRSYRRLVSAAKQLEGPVQGSQLTGSATDPDSDSVATRAPEEDQTPDESKAAQGSLVESSPRISLLVGDVSNAAGWARDLESAMTTVDILVNAAGISVSAVLPKADPDDISKILRTNLEGSLLTSRALVRASIRHRMKTKSATPGDGSTLPSKCIINISSLLALKGGTGAVPYAASKAGILGLTRSLTVEAARTLRGQVIRSNAIVPGYIETPMIADFSQNENEKLVDDIPLRRFGRPSEVADAAVFLAQNEYANNCVINLDGGLSAV